MKIVVCEHCGAKFGLKDHEFSYNFECSVCAGNLVEENGSSQNLDPWYLRSERSSYSTYVVRCKSCGLKYVLDSTEEANDYQCSICSGDLMYFNEEEEIIPERDDRLYEEDGSETNTDFNDLNNFDMENSPEIVDNLDAINSTDFNTVDGQEDIEEDKHQDCMGVNQKVEHQEIKNHFKEKFIDNLDKSDELNSEKVLDDDLGDGELNSEKVLDDDLENETDHRLEKINDKKIVHTTSNEVSSIGSAHDSSMESKPTLPMGSVPTAKSKVYYNTPIGFGLLTVFIGVVDIVTTVRDLGYYVVVFGIMVLIIGIVLHKKRSDHELRTLIFRENLHKLPKDFHILNGIKLPNSDAIDHVVIGSTGIFSILTMNVQKDFDEKIAIGEKDISPDGNFKDDIRIIRNPQNTEGDIKYTISSSPISCKKIEKIKKSNKTNVKFNFDEKIKFDNYDKIKKSSIRRGEELITFLYENNFNSLYLEPLVVFINKIVLVNVPLTDESMFLNDFLNRMVNGKRRLDDEEVKRISNFLQTFKIS
ncbi:MAG: hypothetical protein LBC39_06305 [Methanobrevibacter sp.]|jgi:hypothetical protein|nr:hypothetical protein [Candidatus Methanovirga aequatorialis]